MEVLSEDAQNITIPPLSTQEPPKKKKRDRKKAEPKQSKAEFEVSEDIPVPELNKPHKSNEVNADLLAYTYKLESELASTKKKLKSQKQKFRQLISCLARSIDAKGIDAGFVEDCLQTLGPRLADIDTESNYEKFFTTHKYRILDDSTGQIVDPTPRKEASASKKTASKSTSNVIKIDKAAANGDTLNVPSPHEGQNGTKKKKEKAPKSSGGGETEGKKKKEKAKKHKESEDITSDGDVEILEIPPPKSKPKKEDASHNKQVMPQQQQPPFQMNNMMEDSLKTMMQQANIDPSALMNAYLMAGQMPGVSEADLALYMGKTFQDMMKMGGHSAQGGNDMMNYYQRNFQ